MADCSYSRCIQQRRNIRRDLQRWTKNMVYIVGLERIAEELMGRRKWKLYQDSMHRNHLQPLNNNIKKSEKYQKDSSPQPQEARRSDENSSTATTRERTVAENPPDTRPTVTIVKDEDTGEEAASCGRTSVGPRDRRDEDPVADEESKSKDWSPQSKCYFCVDGKLDEHNNHGALSPRHTDSDSSDSPNNSDLEPPPTLTPSASLLSNLSGRNMTALDSVTSMAALATVAALSGNAPGGPAGGPHLPYYPPGILQPQWIQLANFAARTFQPERAAEAEKSSGEQPLDLSSKGGSSNGAGATDAKINAGMRLPTLDKHIFNSDFRAKPRMSAVAGRRTYTEDELQAALRDIQSGKLGTRRAAVIYGIPRSTLRNKVYKLALEKERETNLHAKFDEDEAMDDDKDLSGAEEEKEVEKALERPLLSMADILRFSNLENADVIKGLLQKGREDVEGSMKAREGLDAEASALGPIRHLIMSGLLKSNEDGITDYVKRLVAEDLLGDQKNGDSEKPSRPSPASSAALTTTPTTTKSFGKSESDMETEDSTSNVILKIPSYKPTSSGSSSKNGDTFNNIRDSLNPNLTLVSPPISSESPPVLPGKGMTLKDVKDVIAKSISQKFQERPEPMPMDFKRVGFTPPLSGMCVVKNQPELRYQPSPQIQTQPQQKPQQNSQNSNSGGSGSGGGKGTRPKRGKYRNYDRDSLVEAVRAVQRGEMSVHRAGSYYGVPHSTLEYKVKERHLMRPRKRDPKPNPVDEKIASLKQNDLRNEKLKTQAQQVLKPQQQQKFSPNGMKLPPQIYENIPLGFTTPAFPFWAHPSFHHIPMEYRSSTSAGFPANPEQFSKAGFPANPEQFPAAGSFPANPEQFFASQMMQKLHEESARVNVNLNVKTPALAKNARQMAESLLDTAGSNGFLDGIIRSSLESGVPNSDDKKEDKNVSPEHMSNKALLDQLCRNSRLTPLTKPNNLTESSSGDDEESVKKGSPENSNSTGHEAETSENIQTIELSNDSNDSSKQPDENKPTSRIYMEQGEDKDATTSSPASRIYLKKTDEKDAPTAMPTGRIYLKQELTKPENLKPEMLVRYRDVVLHDVDNRNGIITEGSASESDAAQD